MDFAELIPKITHYVEILSQAMLGLIVAASAIAQVISGGKYAEDVNSISGKIQKFIGYLPTLGVNPRTKHLEAQLKEMKEAQAKDEPKS